MKENMEQLICVSNTLSIFYGICRINSIGPNGCIEKIFEKKAMVPLRNLLALFYSNCRSWNTPSKFLLGSTKFCGNYGANYEIICLTTNKLLETCVFEKCYLSDAQSFWTVFSLVIEIDKRQGTIFKGTEGTPKNIGQVVRSFL